MIEVSVIIPTHNRLDRLREALNSVLAQRDAAFEVIVIDDGSTDGTAGMLKSEFPSVTMLTQSNQGPAAARNRGMEAARGEWFAFLDSDDRWKKGKLRAQLDFFQAHPDIRIAQTEEIWIRNGRRVNPMKKHRKLSGWIFEACLPLCMISPSAVMLHRTLIDETGLFDETLPVCEDYDLWLRIAAHHPVGLIPRAYVEKYGGHEDQLSKRLPAMDRYRIQALTNLLASDRLTAAQRNAAEAVLREKSRIFVEGARKRGKAKEAGEIEKRVSDCLSSAKNQGRQSAGIKLSSTPMMQSQNKML